MKNKRKLITVAMILLCLLICFADNLWSQETPVPFFSLGMSNKGGIVQAGTFYKKVELQAQFKPAITSRTTPSIVSASVGYKLLDWVTPSIGVGHWSKTDFTAYDNDPTGKAPFTKVTGTSVLYSLEIRHTWWFVGVSHCNETFFSAGIKFHRKF